MYDRPRRGRETVKSGCPGEAWLFLQRGDDLSWLVLATSNIRARKIMNVRKSSGDKHYKLSVQLITKRCLPMHNFIQKLMNALKAENVIYAQL